MDGIRWTISSPKIDVSWVVDSGILCAVSAFRSDDVPTIDAATADISRLIVSPDSIRYSTAWRHPRMDLPRTAGLRGNDWCINEYLVVADSARIGADAGSVGHDSC